MLIVDNNTIIMPNVDNINLDDHDFNKDELWNENSLKNYTLDILNMLEFSYSTSLETPSTLLINDAIYRIPIVHDEDSYDTSFES